uniref:Uncharacterized protein n=1 Tax=Aureoumbra lagunensis TaxID=44058 RepID=A0A7S3JQ93_9STRA
MACADLSSALLLILSKAQNTHSRKSAENVVNSAKVEELVEYIVSREVEEEEVRLDSRCLAAIILRQRFQSGSKATHLHHILFQVIISAPESLRRLVADALVLDANDALLTSTLRLECTHIRNEMLERLCSWAPFIVLPRLQEVINALMLEFSISAMRAAATLCTMAVESPQQVEFGRSVALAFIQELTKTLNIFDDQAVATLLDTVREVVPQNLIFNFLERFEHEDQREARCTRVKIWELLLLHVQPTCQTTLNHIQDLASRALDRAAFYDDNDWTFTFPTSDDEDDGVYSVPPMALEGCFKNDEAVAEIVLNVLKHFGFCQHIGTKFLHSSERRLRLAGMAILPNSPEVARAFVSDPAPKVRAAAFEMIQLFYLFDNEEYDMDNEFWEGLTLDEDLDIGIRARSRLDYEDELTKKAIIACSDNDSRVAIAAAGAAAVLARISESSAYVADSLVAAAARATDPILVAECCKAAGNWGRLAQVPPRHFPTTSKVVQCWLYESSPPVCIMAVVAAAEADVEVLKSTAAWASKNALLCRGLVRCAVIHALTHPPGNERHHAINVFIELALQCFLNFTEEENVRGAAKASCRLLRAKRGIDAILDTNPSRMAAVVSAGLQSELTDVTSLYFLANATISLLKHSHHLLGPALATALNRIANINNYIAYQTESFTWPEVATLLAEAVTLLPESLSNELIAALLLVTRLDDDEISFQVAETLATSKALTLESINDFPNTIIQLRFTNDPATCINVLNNRGCTLQYHAASMGLCSIALNSPGSVVSNRACDFLISKVLLTNDLDSELRDQIIFALLDYRSPSLLHFFPIYTEEPSKARQAHHKLVSHIISAPNLFDTAEIQRIFKSLLESERRPPPWAQFLLRDHDQQTPSPVYNLVLRRHFASNEAATKIAQTVALESQILYPETRAIILKFYCHPQQ